jgi:hypothetical protein
VKKNCDLATITNPAAITPIDYTITAAEIKFALPIMTSSDAICTIGYKITDQDGSTLNPFLIHGFVTATMKIAISSGDNTLAGLYTFAL